MNAYPLIYSRTKHDDFAPQFLTRPKDMTAQEVQEALQFVSNAMANPDTIQSVRYSTFAVGQYCICGGISCLTKNLVDELSTSGVLSTAAVEMAQEYLRDEKNRKTACFIGFAIPRSEIRSGRIPDLQLQDYWEQYLEYLKHQWELEHNHSELLDTPPFVMREKTYSSRIQPERVSLGNRRIVRNFTVNPQETLDYYFHQILNLNQSISFISGINRLDEWNQLVFTDAAISEQLYQSLQEAPQQNKPETMSSSLNMSGMRRSQRSPSVSNSSGDGFESIRRKVKTPAPVPEHDDSFGRDLKKKGSSTGLLGRVIAAVIILAIILFVLVVKH